MRRTPSRRPPVVAALLLAVALVLLGVPAAPAATSAPTRASAGLDGEAPPLVIGHRGASAHRPEHTLASYALAIEQGADFIEPDLVDTKDGVHVARHENEISGTTDVEDRPELADRRTTKTIDGTAVTGWFTEDLTLAELKTLRATERLPQLRPGNTAFDGLEQVPTLEEVLDLARRFDVGVYPETKHPTYFDSIGLSLEEPLLAALERNGLGDPGAKVFIQSFETANLRELDRRTDLPLVQLIGGEGAPADLVAAGDRRTYADLVTRRGLCGIARYADAIGPDKNRIVPRDAQGRLAVPTALVAGAHRAGLLVHPYTFRPENAFLPADLDRGDLASPLFERTRGDTEAELRLFYLLGVDGVFADHPETAVAVRARLFGEHDE